MGPPEDVLLWRQHTEAIGRVASNLLARAGRCPAQSGEQGLRRRDIDPMRVGHLLQEGRERAVGEQRQALADAGLDPALAADQQIEPCRPALTRLGLGEEVAGAGARLAAEPANLA